jgi:hypothetical protein
LCAVAARLQVALLCSTSVYLISWKFLLAFSTFAPYETVQFTPGGSSFTSFIFCAYSCPPCLVCASPALSYSLVLSASLFQTSPLSITSLPL